MNIKLDKISAQLRQRVEEELARQLKDIPNTVQKVVESAILSILGVVREGGGGYRVDTFGKREECLNSYITKKVGQALEKMVGPTVDKEMRRLLKTVSLQKSIATRIATTARYQFEDSFKRGVHDRFAKLGNKMANQISDELEAIMKNVAHFNDEICDPSSFEGKIGELFLEEIARDLSDEETTRD